MEVYTQLPVSGVRALPFVWLLPTPTTCQLWCCWWMYYFIERGLVLNLIQLVLSCKRENKQATQEQNFLAMLLDQRAYVWSALFFFKKITKTSKGSHKTIENTKLRKMKLDCKNWKIWSQVVGTEPCLWQCRIQSSLNSPETGNWGNQLLDFWETAIDPFVSDKGFTCSALLGLLCCAQNS